MAQFRWQLVLVLSLTLFLALTSLSMAQGVTVQVSEHEQLGTILTDGAGRTLYVFANDTDGTSSCYDDCATNWPALTVAAGEDPTGGEGVTGTLGVTDRTTGERQVTYNGMPLYYFAQDTQPGDANGQGRGDRWYVVPPSAMSFADAQAAAAASAQPAAAATPGAAATPATLPTTGGDPSTTPLFLVLFAAGIFTIVVAISLRATRLS